jgi:hypothetical protein
MFARDVMIWYFVSPILFLGPGNWFYIGEENTLDYGLVNLAAFLAHGVTQSIHYDSW